MNNDPVKALKAALTDKLHIDLKSNPVTVALEGSSIIIEGMVEDIARKKRALLIAMGLPGVEGVIDRLRIKPSNPMTDPEIRDHFYAAVEEEPTLKTAGIRAEVKDGVVDIEGTVGSLTHKRLAGVLAWWIPGALDVINSLEVLPPMADNEDELNDALRIVLEKDRLVDALSLTYSNRDYVVTLNGVAGSAEERHAAEEDAWYIWGVNDVVNNIRVEPASVHQLP
ncbi:MAG: BON domain-containing protein [Deltaproteobacteria bacterium]|nr:BON domain-containing protein [Deltaproteobacteria bacterium]